MARAVRLIHHPTDPEKCYILYDDGVVAQRGGLRLPSPNPIVTMGFGNRMVDMQPMEWGDIPSNPISGYFLDARGHVYAYGPGITAVPDVDQVNFNSSGVGAYRAIAFAMNPSGNGTGYVLDYSGRYWRVHVGATWPPAIKYPTAGNVGVGRNIIRDHSFDWSGGIPAFVIVSGQGNVLRHADVGAPVSTWPYYRSLDIIRRIEWNWDDDEGYMIDGYGVTWPLNGAPSIGSAGLWPTRDVVEDFVVLGDWGDTGPLRFKTLTWDGVVRSGIYSSPPRVAITAPLGTNETQAFQLTGSPSGGTFRLTFNGEQTAAIPWDADDVVFAEALMALPGVGIGDISAVNLFAPGIWFVTFGGRWTNQNVPTITLSNNALTGGTSPSVNITTQILSAAAVVTDTVRPQITWTYNDVNLDAQGTVEIKVYTSNGAMPATPPSSSAGAPPEWEKTLEGESVRSTVVDERLENGNYRVYLRARERGGLWSDWDFLDFEMDVTTPAPPTLTPVADPSRAAVVIGVSGTYVGGYLLQARRRRPASKTWEPVRTLGRLASAVLVSDDFNRANSTDLGSTQAVSAFGSLAWHYEGTGLAMGVSSNQAYPVGATSTAFLPSVPGARRARLGSVTVAGTPGHYAALTMRYRSPAWCGIQIRVHHDGSVVLYKIVGRDVAWEVTVLASGFTGALQMDLLDGGRVQIHTDGIDRGTWVIPELIDGSIDGDGVAITLNGSTTRVDSLTVEQGPREVVDYEGTPGTLYIYEVWVVSLDGSLEGDHETTNPVVTPLGGWWLKVPEAPWANLRVACEDDDLDVSTTEDQGVFQPVGASTPIVVSGVIGSARLSRTFAAATKEDYDALVAVLQSQATLLFQTSTGDQWFVRVGADRNFVERMIDSPDGVRIFTVTVPLIEVSRPAVT